MAMQREGFARKKESIKKGYMKCKRDKGKLYIEKHSLASLSSDFINFNLHNYMPTLRGITFHTAY